MFDVNLNEIGVINSKRGLPVRCQMMKGDHVECRFKPILSQLGGEQHNKNTNNNNNTSSQNSLTLIKPTLPINSIT